MPKKFIAAKVNINENIWSGNLDKLIPRIPAAIEAKKSLKAQSWTWRFIDVESRNGFIIGNLSKSRDERHKIVTDNDTTGVQELKNATYNSFFIYDPINEILMFEENSRINRETFAHQWARLVYLGDTTIGDIVVVPFPVEEDLYQKVKGIQFITRIEFEIYPPNMINPKDLGATRDLIRDANGTKLKYIAENKHGLNKEGPYIDSGIDLVKNAYGYVKVTGYDTFETTGKGGKKKTVKNKRIFRSRDSVFHDSVTATDHTKIIDELKQLWERAKSVVRGGSNAEENKDLDS